MPEMWKPKEPDLLKSWVSAIIEEASDDLNEWETEFIESINNHLIAGIQLTQRQEQALERIYADKTK